MNIHLPIVRSTPNQLQLKMERQGEHTTPCDFDIETETSGL